MQKINISPAVRAAIRAGDQRAIDLLLDALGFPTKTFGGK